MKAGSIIFVFVFVYSKCVYGYDREYVLGGIPYITSLKVRIVRKKKKKKKMLDNEINKLLFL